MFNTASGIRAASAASGGSIDNVAFCDAPTRTTQLSPRSGTRLRCRRAYGGRRVLSLPNMRQNATARLVQPLRGGRRVTRLQRVAFRSGDC